MCSVVMACGKGNAKFISIGCINIVVAANAGGAFSPFGDITTLMVWQAGIVEFFTFFKIFFPSVVNYIIPAVIMYFFIILRSSKQTLLFIGSSRSALIMDYIVKTILLKSTT